jgi:predicted kinase
VGRTDLPSASDGAVEREALPETGDREVLRRRLERLPPGHPSSPTADDGVDRKPDQAESAVRDRDFPDTSLTEDEDRRTLTDAEHAERVQLICERLDWARDQKLATDQQYLADRERGIWTRERRDTHDAIVSDLSEESANVPCERKALMAGGLGGAGKSTVLDGYANVDRSRYLTINPDNIKEEMAKRALIPEVEGLSPMEASDLVHEESSHIAKMLAARATKDGKNVIWDITMSSPQSVRQRLDDLDNAGYSTAGIFVDIPIDVAVERADVRYRTGHEDFRAGNGSGGRYVPPEVIRAQADEDWGSVNRRTFEQFKPRFTEWAVYDNSVTGRDPQLVEASRDGNLEEEG